MTRVSSLRRKPRLQYGPAYIPGQNERRPIRRRVHIVRVPARIDIDRIFDRALTSATRARLAAMELEDRIVCEANLLRAVRLSPSISAVRSLVIDGAGIVSSDLPIRWRADSGVGG